MIYQELSLAPHLSVMENIMMGAEPMRYGLIDWPRMRDMASRALAALGHHDIAPDAVVGTLSVAAQQLVEIARAIAVGCRVLVLDEPTSSLGRADVEHLFDLLRHLKSQGHAIVYISHFIEEVKTVADRFIVLRDGRNAGRGDTASASHDDIVALMVGQAVGNLFPRSPRVRGEAILEVSSLEPGSVSFTLHRGEIFGIAGVLGSGRTHLLRTLFGLEPVRSGRVRVGVYSGVARPHERWMQGMGLLSEDRKEEGLALALDIADNVTMTKLSPFGPAGLLFPVRQRSAAARWISELAIKCAGPAQKAGVLVGRRDPPAVEQADLRQIFRRDRQGDEIADRLVDPVIRAIPIEEGLLVVGALVEVVALFVVEGAKVLARDLDAHLDPQVVRGNRDIAVAFAFDGCRHRTKDGGDPRIADREHRQGGVSEQRVAGTDRVD